MKPTTMIAFGLAVTLSLVWGVFALASGPVSYRQTAQGASTGSVVALPGTFEPAPNATGVRSRATADVARGIGTLATTDVIINEVDSDTPGADSAEFVELYDGGTGNTPLDGLVVVFFNGSDDASYYRQDLDGFSTDADGYFVLGNNISFPVQFKAGTLQNGADAVALYLGNDSDFPDDTAVTTANLLDAIVYDTNDATDSGLLVLLNPGEPQVNEAGGGDSATDSNQRCPNGSGGQRNTASYVQKLPSPGVTNNCDTTAITLDTFEAVQGSGGVTVTWVTGTELDNAGFNLHRATSEAGPYTKINGDLLPAKGDAVSGAAYRYLDPDAGDPAQLYYYQLEDIDLNGVSTFHGPIVAGSNLSGEAGRFHLFLPVIFE